MTNAAEKKREKKKKRKEKKEQGKRKERCCSQFLHCVNVTLMLLLALNYYLKVSGKQAKHNNSPMLHSMTESFVP